MLPQEIIRRKRDGAELTGAEIAFFVEGLTRGGITEGQIAAFAMAVFFRGMSMAERIELTRAMMRSGDVISWRQADLGGPVLDKHSTGGVGDKVSLILAPLVAAAGGFVPMISGRGLGHTGGTLDKLESIPGYQTRPDIARFRDVVRAAGCAIIGQTADLAPADRRLYAVRDVTATVESVPLITASILSKKLAAGLEGLVMDVKTGSGAFAASRAMADELAESIVAVANGAGLRTVALLTDMNQVLGQSAGNAVEVRESIAFLRGEAADARLREVTLALAAEMLLLGGLGRNEGEARARARAALESGQAAERFARMVADLGGPRDLLERPDAYLPAAPVVRPCPPSRAGRIAAMDTRAIGLSVVRLGGGRLSAEDGVDHRVGFTAVAGLGQEVGPDRPLALVHAASEAAAAEAAAELAAAVVIADDERERAAGPIVLGRVAV
ncbi:MAG: thymidine phosphorylase [Alphaproteobacteria bacterium]|nr:thymidine phosphorylase [Alphaproteobacteria bacterium]